MRMESRTSGTDAEEHRLRWERWLREPNEKLGQSVGSMNRSRELFPGLTTKIPYREVRLSPMLKDNAGHPENQGYT